MPRLDYLQALERLKREQAEIGQRLARGRAMLDAPMTAEAAEAYRQQFNQDWNAIAEEMIGYDEAPVVAGRYGHPGEPPLYANDPEYVPPDALPPDRPEVFYDDLTEFLFGAKWLNVSSSNIRAIQYHDKEELLYIEYISGAIYGYTGVTVDEAMDFASAPSKGRWRWQHLPVSRNNYFIVTAASTSLPKHAQSGAVRFQRKKFMDRAAKSYRPQGF
jgi:hypothetical protein